MQEPEPALTLEDILLLRLWRGKARELGMTRSDLFKSVPNMCKADKPQVQSAIDGLLDDGGVRQVGPRSGRVEATDDGLARLRDHVVIDDSWRKLKWTIVWNRALTATALGRRADHAKELGTADGLWSMLLMEAAGLEWQPGLTKAQAEQKIVAHHLGTRPGKIEDFRAELLARAMRGRPAPPPPRDPEPESEPDPKAFARLAINAARSCPTGRVGGEEVFIASVWEHGHTLDPPLWTMDLATFKTSLAGAFKLGLVRLTRCDMAPAFDDGLVASSEVTRLGQSFHFILTLDP